MKKLMICNKSNPEFKVLIHKRILFKHMIHELKTETMFWY